jgi:LysR family glycine cleavage system transcriptional activator
MFAETPFDAALYAGTPQQLAQWAGTQSIRLLAETVVPVCSPALIGGQPTLSATDISKLPLLQQSTRPDGWQSWFAAQEVDAPLALSGPRYEQFSMAVAAAQVGLGLALVPTLLVEQELARGALVVAHPQALAQERHYCLVLPEGPAVRPAMQAFIDWLVQTASDNSVAA